MLFTNPAAIWGILFFFGLIVIYIYKRRSRNYRVSSLMFFAKSKSTAEGGQKLNKLETPLIFFIELFILLLLLLAIAGPMCLQKGKLIPVTIVFDDSISMKASAGGFSPRDQAIKYLEKNFFSEKIYRFTLIKAGNDVSIMGKRDLTGNEALEILKGWKCESAFCDIMGAVTHSTEISSEDALLIAITDFYPKDSLSKNIKWFAFGKSLENIAITSASRIKADSVDRCFFEFTNFSEKEKEINAEIINVDTNEVIERITGKIGAGFSRRTVIKLKDRDVTIKAKINDDNILFDNEAVLVPVIRKKIKVALNFENKGLEASVKKAVDSTELALISNTKPDVVITDNKVASLRPSFLNMSFYVSSQPVLLQAIIAADKDHPITNDIPMEQSSWAVDKNIKIGNNCNVLLSSGGIPVLWIDSSTNDYSKIGFNYCFDYSNLHQTNFWPVLFYNIMEWASNNLNGPSSFNCRSGNRIEIHTEKHVKNILVNSINDKTQKEECPVAYGKAFFNTYKTGLYDIKDEENTYRISVNLCSYDESDLRAKVSQLDNITIVTNENMSHFENVRWWFVILAFLLMIVHQWLVSKRRLGYAF